MKKGIIGNIIILLFSIISLATQMISFWNAAIFCDEHNTNPGAIYGGDVWNIMQWVVMALLLVVIIIATIRKRLTGRPIDKKTAPSKGTVQGTWRGRRR